MPLDPQQELELLRLKKKKAMAAAQQAPVAAPEDDQSFTDKAGHGVGITARAAAQGLGNFFAMPENLAVMGVNGMRDQMRGVVPENMKEHIPPPIKTPGQGFADFLSKVGAPEPQTFGERLYSDTVEGAAPGALFGPIGLLSGAMGGLASGATREAGGGPVLQTLAGLVGGAVPGVANMAGSVAKSAGKTAADLVRPLNQAGRETIVGRVLRDQATDPEAAMANMVTAPEFVPGSKPTTGVASKDPGLIGLERQQRNVKPKDFAEVDTANQTARNQHLNEVAGQPEDVAAMKKARSEAGDAGRAEAFANKSPVKPQSATAMLEDISGSPTGKRDAVKTAMSWVKTKLDEVTQKSTVDADPEELYAIRQDISDAISGKFDSEKPALRLASKELAKVRDALDDDIELGAEGYQAYLQKYREDSIPIKQKETLQDMRSSAETAVPNPITGERNLSQAKWTNLIKQNGDDYRKTLSPEQMKRVENIAADLDRGASINSFRPSGSDTAANLTMSNVLGNLMSKQRATSPFMRNLQRPLAFMYQIPEEATQRLLTEAMKDPQIAAKLMAKPSAKVSEALSVQLKAKAKAMGLGAAIGGAQAAKPDEDVVK